MNGIEIREPFMNESKFENDCYLEWITLLC